MYKYSIGIIFGCIMLSLAYMVQENPHGDQFNLDCDLCHNLENWQVLFSKISFDHARTDFPLYGAHRVVGCRSCHVSLVFTNVGQKCVNCHTDIHQGEFGVGCEDCHSPQSWENRQDLFARHSQTRFPLLGVHAMLDCETCHPKFQQPQFKQTAVDCRGCHLHTYQQTTDPNHARVGFGLECDNCHSPAAWTWQNVVYEHTPLFPLTGGHSKPSCGDCHSAQYAGTSALCFSCHEADYRSATDPNHMQNNFDHDCSTCHNIIAWDPATFDHNLTSFPLTGTHTSLTCTQCHANGYVNTPADCYSCHAGDYNGAADPNHLASNFNHDCSGCHNTNTWQPAYFDHATTNFPLSGAHTGVGCGQCHSSGYTNTPTECFACHESDFNGVNDPNHVSNNFDHNCTPCHNTLAWQPSVFNHSQTSFPLTGAHVSLTCIQCHSSGYTSTPAECINCHQQNYDQTNNPNHLAAHFPVQCSQCHNTTAWQPANWNHDGQYFPIYSGAHQDKWSSCNTCHTNPNDYVIFSCITCHEHNQTEMNAKHIEVPNYTYDSNLCYSCHPTGRAGD